MTDNATNVAARLHNKLCHNIFNFKKKLKYNKDETQLHDLLEQSFYHLREKNISELRAIEYLRESLLTYSYKTPVKNFIQRLTETKEKNRMVYELADLFHQLQSRDNANLQSPALYVIKNLINKPNDRSRMDGIVNELSNYTFIPEVRAFIMKYDNDPFHKETHMSIDNIMEKVNTFIEPTENGDLVFVSDTYFLLKENEIKIVYDLKEHVKDIRRVNELLLIGQALREGRIEDSIFNIQLNEDINLGASISDMREAFFINFDPLNERMTLESIFESGLIPFNLKGYYNVFETVFRNRDQFIELESCLHIKNKFGMANMKECYIFNHNNTGYVYEIDPVNGPGLYHFPKIRSLVESIRSNYHMEVAFFYADQLGEYIQLKEKVDRRIKKYEIEIQDLRESIRELKEKRSLIVERYENGEQKYNELLAQLLIEEKELLEKKEHLLEKIHYNNPKRKA